ncbi:MAG: DNA methyltransferase, partial [Rubrivivax sp.]
MLTLLPVDGSKVPNGQLRPKWVQAAAAAGAHVTEAEFEVVRDRLLAAGLVVKGVGRGGATGRAAGAAPGPDDFTLQTAEAPAEEPAGQPVPAKKTKAAPTPRPAGDEPAQVISYRHADRRKNNPEVGLVSEASDPQQPKKTWAYNPHLDPVLNFDSSRAELENQVADALASGDAAAMRAALEEIQRCGAPYLQWAGKAERTSFEVDTVSLHVHERVDPMSILSAVRKGGAVDQKAKPAKDADQSAMRQASLFEAPFENLPLRDAVDFYRHDKGWANRLVSGDSLQVMNSLLVKEGMAGQVQMVYIDPPYGIKYGSNFQPFVGKLDVKDKSDVDLTREPETIKAFRDTWDLGIHSYLTYLRDRVTLSHQMLTASGSIFVQISDENEHLVRTLLDEVFGVENYISTIRFKKSTATSSGLLPTSSDLLIW